MWAPFYYSTNAAPDTTNESYGGFYRNTAENYREVIEPEKMMVPRSTPRILLVDDDPTFGKIMKKAAKSKNIPLTYCKSILEFSQIKKLDYDVLLVDYDLGEVNGSELTSYIEQFTSEEIPVILISQTNQKSSSSWPATIREFVHKRVGPFAILDAAFEAHEVNLIMKMVVKNQ